jgi:hypothetical protein
MIIFALFCKQSALPDPNLTRWNRNVMRPARQCSNGKKQHRAGGARSAPRALSGSALWTFFHTCHGRLDMEDFMCPGRCSFGLTI